MSRLFTAEYDARDNILKLEEALPGVHDREKVRISIEASHTVPADPLKHLESLDAPTGDLEQLLSEIDSGRR